VTLEPRTLPVLPLRDLVFFPTMVLPLLVGRRRSVAALEQALAEDALLLLLHQRDAETEDPNLDDLHPMGTVVRVLEASPLTDGTWRVVFEGIERAHAAPLETPLGDGPLLAHSRPAPYADVQTPPSAEAEARARRVLRAAREYVRLHTNLPDDLANVFAPSEDRVRLLHLVAGHLTISAPEKQALLNVAGVDDALRALLETLDREIEVLRIEEKLSREIQGGSGSLFGDAGLPESLRGIAGGWPPGPDPELWSELAARIEATPLPHHARTRVDREFSRLTKLNPASPESGVIRGYLDWILDLPWGAIPERTPDVATAREVLEGAHYGLGEVKDRILDDLAVLSLVGAIRGPILCLVGPPGVGKTSLAKSIAEALQRPYVRVALGGVRDEAEIRGHRRTYVGSLPGKILQGMRRAGARNPVFLLDEVDKIARDAHGDPASALLEVLDPEQNHAFQDHYLELEYDLSDVLFVATANTLNEIPEPLRDRMEVLRIPGYLETEKRTIARSFLAPGAFRRHGLIPDGLEIPDEAMTWLVEGYTREAGVRELSRVLSRVARKLAREVAEGVRSHDEAETLTIPRLRALLGPSTLLRSEREPGPDRVGVATGLAWTAAGGELLEVEVAAVPGTGKIQLTGTLGDVMKESAVAALTYARSRAGELGLRPHFHQEVDIHVHIPEGATPKDGPSAGITMASALISALTGIPTRSDVAMTGELTLRGRVLPVGGIREKAVAALRSGLRTVLVPADNLPELEQLPAEVRDGLEFIPVRGVDEVLHHALSRSLKSLGDAPFPVSDPFPSASH
jgi:ATP-dependent Lon protease